MRYDKPIYFQTDAPGEYDAATGNYGADTITEVQKRASVTDTGTEVLQLIYGELKQGSLIVRLQQPYTAAFDRIRIGEKLYKVDYAKLHKKVFVVSEVQ